VREYLSSLAWDQEPRIERWLIDYAGAPDTPYVRAISRIVLVAACRRIRKPGSKFDEMVILESSQGTNKSSALRALAFNDDWFTDDLPLHGDTRRLMESTAGKWIVEAGELKGMGRSDVAALKACLSRQRDEARLAYGHKSARVLRQFVIIGTTNETTGYFRDETGNRRFWPVRIQLFNLEKLRADRDQLWAEAAETEALGESIRLDPRLYEAAAAEQEARLVGDDPLVDVLHRALANRTGKLRVSDAYLICGIEPGKVNQDQISRFGRAIRELGWERQRRRFDGSLQYAYVRGTAAEREVEVELDQGPGNVVVATCNWRSPATDNCTL
jgi:predicted P-loop ATPase